MITDWPTDKTELGYLKPYEAISTELLTRLLPAGQEAHPLRWLEVGTAHGGGLKMFRDLFGPEGLGVELDPDNARISRETGIEIIECSQDDPGLPLVLAQRPPFDVIMDDASHLPGPTAVTLAQLWPLVAPGGFYVVEDWNYFDAAGMASNLWQKLFGTMLAYPVIDHRPKTQPPFSGMLDNVDTVTVRQGMIIIRKACPAGP